MKDEGRATGGLDPTMWPRQPVAVGSAVTLWLPVLRPWAGRDGHAGRTYAALDFGTNNCRLLARAHGTAFV